MYTLEFEIGGLPILPNAMSRGHWSIAAREAKKWKRWVFFSCKTRAPSIPLKRAKLIFTRFSYSGKGPDCDGLVHSFKHVRDGLKDAGIIEDDSPTHVFCEYRWERVGPKKGKIRVRVEEL